MSKFDRITDALFMLSLAAALVLVVVFAVLVVVGL